MRASLSTQHSALSPAPARSAHSPTSDINPTRRLCEIGQKPDSVQMDTVPIIPCRAPSGVLDVSATRLTADPEASSAEEQRELSNLGPRDSRRDGTVILPPGLCGMGHGSPALATARVFSSHNPPRAGAGQWQQLKRQTNDHRPCGGAAGRLRAAVGNSSWGAGNEPRAFARRITLSPLGPAGFFFLKGR